MHRPGRAVRGRRRPLRWRYAAAGISPTEALAGTVPKEALLSLAAVANGVLPAPAGTGMTGIDWATTRARLGHTR